MMLTDKKAWMRSALLLMTCHLSAVAAIAQGNPAIPLDPARMAKLGSVDPRFASYNIEMVEVTGGRFWKPYKSSSEANAPKPATSPDANQQVGSSSSLFDYRPPINLADPRLRKLAEALGPSYVRVSGSWQNSTYFQNDDQPALKETPKGFRGVLTRAEWKGVVEFARATGGEIVTSFAISPGTRDENGVCGRRRRRRLSLITQRASAERSPPRNS